MAVNDDILGAMDVHDDKFHGFDDLLHGLNSLESPHSSWVSQRTREKWGFKRENIKLGNGV